MCACCLSTVDPNRDTLPVLKAYVEHLRARRSTACAAPRTRSRGWRGATALLYQVTPASPGNPYEVVHANTVFFFAPDGRARMVTTSTGGHQGPGRRYRTVVAGLTGCRAVGRCLASDMQRASVGVEHRFVQHLAQRRVREDGVGELRIGQLARLWRSM